MIGIHWQGVVFLVIVLGILAAIVVGIVAGIVFFARSQVRRSSGIAR